MDQIRLHHKKSIGSAIYPNHQFVKNWIFDDGEEQEAKICHELALLAEKNGLNANDMRHLFPAVLRMFKSDIRWAK